MAREVKMNVPPRKGRAARWRREPPRSKAAASASKAGTGRSMQPPTPETCGGRERLRRRRRAGDIARCLAAEDEGPARRVQVMPSPHRATVRDHCRGFCSQRHLLIAPEASRKLTTEPTARTARKTT